MKKYTFKKYIKSKGERLGWESISLYKPSLMKDAAGNGKIIRCSCKEKVSSILLVT